MKLSMQQAIGVVVKLTGYAAIWWILAGGDATSWSWGVPAVLLAALCTPPATGPWRWRWLPGFVRLFLWLSLRSALEVGYRALHPRQQLSPALVDYLWRLPPGPSRLFLAGAINLIPGTLSLHIRKQAVTIHVLNNVPATLHNVARLEARVAALFDVRLG